MPTATKFLCLSVLVTSAFFFGWMKPRLEALSDEMAALRRERSILIKAVECQRTHIKARDDSFDPSQAQITQSLGISLILLYTICSFILSCAELNSWLISQHFGPGKIGASIWAFHLCFWNVLASQNFLGRGATKFFLWYTKAYNQTRPCYKKRYDTPFLATRKDMTRCICIWDYFPTTMILLKVHYKSNYEG